MQHLSLEQIEQDTVRLFLQIYQGNEIHPEPYIPTAIGAVWKGGCSLIAPLIIELFEAFGHTDIYHMPFKARSYQRPGENEAVRLDGLGSFKERLTPNDKVLIIEDIVDTGSTHKRIMSELSLVTENARFAVLYWRKDKHKGGIRPDYFVEPKTDWQNFPHEVSDIVRNERGLLIPEGIAKLRDRGGAYVQVADLLELQRKIEAGH
ncbi:hypothetical protein D6745_00475 [Candidatus Woesearchaeota archaeon]|nr:MAG: hypothetical protein D6745_00475 [Candidatus Woesearchaeota archaeon]